MTWDGQTRRGQARRARVILFGLDPFVVMVDGAAGGTYREQSWAEWSKHSTFHDRGGGGLVMGVSAKKNQSESGWLALGIHLGLSRSSLFPDCSSVQWWDRNQPTIKIPPSTAASPSPSLSLSRYHE